MTCYNLNLKYEYAHLCNQQLPYTNQLFGDDVSKAAKEKEAELVSGVVSESEHEVSVEAEVSTQDQLVMLELIQKTLR
ncbi:hypothetical protein DPMN_000268 [Dreissena polymorpha]|uniref:Uncharacterized protein n=1 Tax=Dreissena polymorpha TaxID=45954 RepID=A0A9D4MH15_DREPO|nr:hypothetical protein DPMN_000268 [Dreissena polymorpha]